MFKSKYTLPTHGLSLSLSFFIPPHIYIYIIMFYICISRYRRITVSRIIIGFFGDDLSNRIRFIFRNIVPFSKNNLCVRVYIYISIYIYIYTHFLVRLISGEPLRFERERERAKIRSMFRTALKKTSSDRIAQPILRPWSTRHPAVLQCTTPVFAQKTVVCSWLVWGGEDKVWIFNGETAKTLMVLCDEQMSRENFQYFPSYMSSN